jgi:DNA-binding NarL/FixJ family response regulator
MHTEVEGLIRILLIEPQTITRAGLRLLIESWPRLAVAGEAGACDEALAIAEKERPDIVIFEPDFGGENRVSLISELTVVASAARVIVLTSERNHEMQCAGIRLGALGLVLKNESPETLRTAIQKVHEGEMWIERSIAASVIAELRSEHTQKAEGGATRINALTAREREVAILISEGLNNQQIADRLYLSKATVRHHITSIFSKLDVSDRIGLLIYCYRNGLAKPPGRSDRSTS